MSNENRAGAGRRHDLDALRAFAMLVGIVFHATLPFATTGWYVSDWNRAEGLGAFTLWVHGFRMPLFLFVSGYFTQMMWRRKGLAPTVGQRVLRILLPLVIGTFTLLPLQDAIVSWARTRAASDDALHRGSRRPATPLADAARSNDVASVVRLLAAGTDPNQADADLGMPALSWASNRGDTEAVRRLLDAGADPNRPSPGGHRPLHGAAYFARPETVALLLQRGADPNQRNDAGEAPLVAASKGIGEVQTIAGWIGLEWSMPPAAFEAAREACRARLLEAGARPVSGSQSPPDTLRSAYHGWLGSDRFLMPGHPPFLRPSAGDGWHLIGSPVFDHLWFLAFLCWLVAFHAVVAAIAGRNAHTQSSGGAWRNPRLFVVLLALPVLPQFFMTGGPGPDTSVGLLPPPHLLLYYGIFYATGAFTHDTPVPVDRLGRHWPWLLPVSTLVALPIGVALQGVSKAASGFFQVVYAWGMILGFLGLFRRTLSNERPAVRYLSDAAYWMYLAHHPLVVLIHVWVRPTTLPALAKLAVLCLALAALLLTSYHLLVRPTWIGWLLNGRMYPFRNRTPAK